MPDSADAVRVVDEAMIRWRPRKGPQQEGPTLAEAIVHALIDAGHIDGEVDA